MRFMNSYKQVQQTCTWINSCKPQIRYSFPLYPLPAPQGPFLPSVLFSFLSKITGCSARGVEGEDGLDGDVHGRHVERLEHDLGHLLAVCLLEGWTYIMNERLMNLNCCLKTDNDFCILHISISISRVLHHLINLPLGWEGLQWAGQAALREQLWKVKNNSFV